MSEESGLPTGQNRDNERLMLVLAYFGPLGLIPYLTMADNDFVRWHARQGLTLTGVWILTYITIGLLAPIPLLGWMLVLLAPRPDSWCWPSSLSPSPMRCAASAGASR